MVSWQVNFPKLKFQPKNILDTSSCIIFFEDIYILFLLFRNLIAAYMEQSSEAEEDHDTKILYTQL